MKHTKKAIRQLVEDALQQVSLTLDLSKVSRKTRKAFQQASRDLSGPLRDDLKKKYKKEEKLLSSSRKVARKSA